MLAVYEQFGPTCRDGVTIVFTRRHRTRFMMFELGRHQGTSHLDPFTGCNARSDIAVLVCLFALWGRHERLVLCTYLNNNNYFIHFVRYLCKTN